MKSHNNRIKFSWVALASTNNPASHPCIDDVVEESQKSSSIKSWGVETDGVFDGEMIKDDDICDSTLVDVKFLNIANIESALDTFGLMRRPSLRPMSFIANSEPAKESWLDEELFGDLDSFALGVGGTELGRWIISRVLDDGRFNDFKFDVLCWCGTYYKQKKNNLMRIKS